MTTGGGLRGWAWILILAADAGIVLYGVLALATPSALTAAYETYTGSTWESLVASTPAAAAYVLLVYRLVGGLNVGLGVTLIAVVAGPYRRGERWAWFAVLMGNVIGFGVPMTYDQITGAVGTFEILEFVAVGAVVIGLLLFPWSRPATTASPGLPLRTRDPRLTARR